MEGFPCQKGVTDGYDNLCVHPRIRLPIDRGDVGESRVDCRRDFPRGLLKIPHAQVSDYGARWVVVVFTRPAWLDSVDLGRGAVRGRSIRFSFLLRASTRRLDLKIVQSPTERAGRHQAIGRFRITVVVAERESVAELMRAGPRRALSHRMRRGH